MSEKSDLSPYCKTCGYSVRTLSAGTCPECGQAFDPLDPTTVSTTWWADKVSRWIFRATGLLCVSAAVAPTLLAVALLLPVAPSDAATFFPACLGWTMFPFAATFGLAYVFRRVGEAGAVMFIAAAGGCVLQFYLWYGAIVEPDAYSVRFLVLFPVYHWLWVAIWGAIAGLMAWAVKMKRRDASPASQGNDRP